MKKLVLFTSLLFILIIAFSVNNSYAVDLDRIVNYVVTVDPRMSDGSLDITYEITWEVLNSTQEGPLEWVKIGTPNSKFDNITALSSNIKSISQYEGSYVKIVFDKSYYEGEELTFRYKIHQSYMYTLTDNICEYSFTPAWFTDSKVDSITIMWNAKDVNSSNSNLKEGNYLLWYKTDLSKGEKVTTNIKYKQSAFTELDSNKQVDNAEDGISGSIKVILVIVVIICILFARKTRTFTGGGGYYRHRGFYGGHGYRSYSSSSCVHSSCACVSSCACACACAGSGRAGCSKKDFYGTKINNKKIKNEFN